MTVTFSAIHLVHDHRSIGNRKVFASLEGSPELNVANTNASALLWSVFDIPPEKGVCGDMPVSEAARKLAFWLNHGGPKAIVKENDINLRGSGRGGFIHNGRTYEQTVSYAEKLHEILTFAALQKNKGLDSIRLGWV